MVLLQTDLPGIPLHARGKVRDVYRTGPRQLLIVATDRISAFDCVLPTGIPDKGRILTAISLFWFDFLRELTPNHLITADVEQFPTPLQAFRDQLEGRSMLVEELDMAPVECVARGYLAGSGWKEYRETQAVCGIPLPAGLRESDALPEPIFTPATKAATGHDENISLERTSELVGNELAAQLRDLTLTLYRRASDHARSAGIILADTKFEFGQRNGRLVVGDEVLTPDSSRFWPSQGYTPGRSQPSFDKQYVRDYLETLDWDKRPPAPPLPEEVARRTSEKYHEAYRILTGKPL